MEYRYAVEGLYPVSAQEAGEELERIEKQFGEITASKVVDESTPAEALLHPCFEWRDEVAGARWRLYEARQLIGNVRQVVVRREEDKQPETIPVVTQRAFSNVAPYRHEGRYQSTGAVMRDTDKSAIVLDNARREFVQLKRKYENLIDFKSMALEILGAEA